MANQVQTYSQYMGFLPETLDVLTIYKGLPFPYLLDLAVTLFVVKKCVAMNI